MHKVSKNNKIEVIHFKDLDIHISRRRIKNLNMYIRPPHGQVLITVPLKVTDDYICSFVERKYDWILKSQEKIREKSQQRMGQESGLSELKYNVSEEQIEHLKELIQMYANKYERIMGVHCVKWTIRDMKTRWGSCSVNKATIRINLQLANRPEECVEYIVVHELTHLLEASHNKVFKGYMTRFLPDWKERQKML